MSSDADSSTSRLRTRSTHLADVVSVDHLEVRCRPLPQGEPFLEHRGATSPHRTRTRSPVGVHEAARPSPSMKRSLVVPGAGLNSATFGCLRHRRLVRSLSYESDGHQPRHPGLLPTTLHQINGTPIPGLDRSFHGLLHSLRAWSTSKRRWPPPRPTAEAARQDRCRAEEAALGADPASSGSIPANGLHGSCWLSRRSWRC